MTDLAAQILAALDRAEERSGDASWRGRLYNGEWQIVDVEDGEVVATVAHDFEWSHIAANDPAHVLRLCAALREVVKLHNRTDPWLAEDICGECMETAPCPTLRALASVWDVPGVAE